MSIYEPPTFKFDIFYYDTDPELNLAEVLQTTLTAHGFFPPSYLQAGRLTRGKFIKYKDKMEEYLKRAYVDPKCVCPQILNSESPKSYTFFRIDWSQMKRKVAAPPDLSKKEFLPWNILGISVTHDLCADPVYLQRVMALFQELIVRFNAFYATAEDISVSLSMSRITGLNRGLPKRYGRVREICWLNYFGPKYCELFPVERLKDITLDRLEPLGNGMLFTLTESILDYNSEECLARRRAAAQALDILPPNHHYRPEGEYELEPDLPLDQWYLYFE